MGTWQPKPYCISATRNDETPDHVNGPRTFQNMWVGMMQKFRTHKHNFGQDEDDNGVSGEAGTSASKAPATTDPATDPPQSTTITMTKTAARGAGRGAGITASHKVYLRKKWRVVFRRIIKVMRAVETMQSELKRQKMKGEVEPSPLMRIVCELSRRAAFTTEKGLGGGLLGVKRSKRPGHSDHAPVLVSAMGGVEGVTQLPSMFSFSTDILGSIIQSAIVPILAKKPQHRTDKELNTLSHILRGLHFFGVLPSGPIVELLRSAQIVRMEVGDILYKRGDEPGSAYCILSGALSVIVRHGGLNFTACDLFSGTSVGEQAVASGLPQVNTVMATRTSLLLSLPTYLSVLDKLKAQDLRIKTDFLRNVTILGSMLSSECLRKIAEQLHVVRVEESARICKAGSPITHLVFVKSGQLRTLKVVAPKSRGRRFVVEVQTLSPHDCFGMNAFCHVVSHGAIDTDISRRRKVATAAAVQTMAKRTKKKKKKNDLPDNVFRGSYLGHLVSKTYCELFEIEIQKAQAILTKDQIQVLSEYGAMTRELYNNKTLSVQLDSSLDWRERRKMVLENARQDWRALQEKCKG